MADIKNEIWKETHLNPYYLVSNMGRVKSIERDVPVYVNGTHSIRHKKEHFLTPHDHHGYYHVGFKLQDGTHVNPLVHQLVMFAFNEIKKYPEWEIDHINGDSHDNRLENLEYVSSSENTKRAYNLGLQDKAKLSLSKKNRKMTPEQILEMKNTFNLEGRKWGVGNNNKDFLDRYAKKYNMQPGSIAHILSGVTNRFFGEDIVQTTKNNYHYLAIEDIPEQGSLANRAYFKLIANILGVGWRGIETMIYHKHKSIKDVVSYYNDKYL